MKNVIGKKRKKLEKWKIDSKAKSEHRNKNRKWKKQEKKNQKIGN